MTGPTHAISGLAAAVLVGRLTPFAPGAVDLLAILLGSLAPDIDGNGVITKPGTILRRFIGKTLAEVLDIVASFFAAAVRLIFGHRGLIHAPLLAACFFLIGWVAGVSWLCWFSLGYAVHLLGDAFTYSGIPVFAPFSDRRMSLSRMRSGGRLEFVLASLLLLCTIVCGWTLLPEGVKQNHLYLLGLLSKKLGSS